MLKVVKNVIQLLRIKFKREQAIESKMRVLSEST